MKKMRMPQQMTSLDRKLRLDRETVRQLDAESLEQAWGGAVDTIVRPTDACPTPTGGH
jgi:hypothetical protein